MPEATELPEGHRPPEDRVEQDCFYCKQSDVHPRHTSWFEIKDPRDPKGEAILDLSNTHHFDCGRDAGCEHCVEVMAASDSAHGDELVAHLTADSTPVDHNAHLVQEEV